MKKHFLLFNLAALAFLSCGSAPENNAASGNEAGETTSAENSWQDLTKENISGKWAVSSYESDMNDAQKIVGKEFHFDGDTLRFSYFIMGNEVETRNCFYELTADGTINVTVPMENGDKWIEFSGGIDNGLLSLDHKGAYLKLKKIN